MTTSQHATASVGSLVVIRPGDAITMTSPAFGMTAVHVALRPGSYEPALSSAVIPAGRELFQTAQLIHREIAERHERIQILAPACQLFTLQALRQAAASGHDVNDWTARDWAERITTRIQHYLYSPVSIADILSDIPLSDRQLARYFQQVHGMSIKRYQLHARLDEACDLLHDTDLAITTIAFELGFPSSQHFATQFRRYKGTTPTQWRNSNTGI